MEIKDAELGTYASTAIRTALIPLSTSVDRSKSTVRLEIFLKRIVDIVGSVFGIIALIPLTILIYIANLLSGDKGPLFYTQKRIGKDGKSFNMYKYRSMVVNAEEKLEKYLQQNEDAKIEYSKYKKLKNDPRITKIGRFIRKTSLDEFLQFINVLKGEMSLVGPRPYLPNEKEDMRGYYKYIVKCKPGLTGFWQTNGRSEVTFDERLGMDLKYFNNHCLKVDLKLLKKTAEKLVKKEGAI